MQGQPPHCWLDTDRQLRSCNHTSAAPVDAMPLFCVCRLWSSVCLCWHVFAGGCLGATVMCSPWQAWDLSTVCVAACILAPQQLHAQQLGLDRMPVLGCPLESAAFACTAGECGLHGVCGCGKRWQGSLTGSRRLLGWWPGCDAAALHPHQMPD